MTIKVTILVESLYSSFLNLAAGIWFFSAAVALLRSGTDVSDKARLAIGNPLHPERCLMGLSILCTPVNYFLNTLREPFLWTCLCVYGIITLKQKTWLQR